ncbi:MAG TPA: GNAT family N-acetyltransferase [Woeseiaceae bacterium]|nr:GNAT family N-acetyltransferase [Woeseiaceae bacterium]
MKRQVRPPERLSARHDCSEFRNGKHPSLDVWLRHRAFASEGLSARTYVICDAGVPDRVVGYHAISTAMEQRIALPNAKLRRGMPEQVPLLLIGRLAIDSDSQGMGLGTDLLADALRRCVAASDIAAARGIIAHAIDADAVRYYERHGFRLSSLGERVMLMPIEYARAIVED